MNTSDIMNKGDRVKGIRTWNGEIIEGIFQCYKNISKKNTRIVGVIYVENDRCYDVCISSLCKIENC